MAEPVVPHLDPLTLPLRGTRLIEASAGTGKTFTIAALYVRLVLGHGVPGKRSLLPSQVLVMTFTKAATRELSHRIRARLVEAAACFRGVKPPASYDVFLQGLLLAYPEAEEREQAAWRLASAAEAMDEAAVFTIDAWCQRMLREHAFDSGSLFDEELQPNESALLLEATADYWRQQVYPLQAGAAELALASFKDVATLAKNSRGLLGEAWSATHHEKPLSAELETFLVARGLARASAALAGMGGGGVATQAVPISWNQVRQPVPVEVAWRIGDMGVAGRRHPSSQGCESATVRHLFSGDRAQRKSTGGAVAEGMCGIG
jgi:exodeoxyribonuclease V beta subunit